MGEHEILPFELAEDFAVMTAEKLVATQAKYTKESGSFTLNGNGVRQAIGTLVTLADREPDRSVYLRYMSTSLIGIETSLCDSVKGSIRLDQPNENPTDGAGRDRFALLNQRRMKRRRGGQMTIDELHGRMAALEVISLTALGLYLANAANDPDMSKARSVLDHLRMMIEGRAAMMPDEAAGAARAYGDELLSIVLENLRLLRPG